MRHVGIRGIIGSLFVVLLAMNACSVHPFSPLSAISSSLNSQSSGGPGSSSFTSPDTGPVQPPYPAHSYFVSNTGNDANDGSTPQTAWQTVAKVNASSFPAGSLILFSRDGVWRESLKAPSSGNTGNPITFADYGSSAGAKPKFLGSVVLTNSQFQSAGGGIYTYSISSEVFSVLANQTFLLFPQGQPAQTMAGSWSYSSPTLTLNSPSSDPRTNGQTYEAVTREDVIASNAKNHLVFRNLVADETAHYGGGYAFRIEQSQDVLVYNCEAYRAGKHHFGVINTTGFIGQRLYSAYAMPGQHWASGDSASAYVSYGDSTGVANQTSEWDDTIWEFPTDPQAPGNNYYAFFTHGANIGSVKIKNMISHQGNLSLSNGDNLAASVSMLGGLIDDARLEVDGNGVVVDGIHISGELGTVDLIGANLILQNAMIEGTNLGSQWYQTAVASRGLNNTIRFSTISLSSSAPTSNACLTEVNANTQLHFYANILISTGRVFQLFDQNGTLNSSSIAEAHDNLYLANATFAFITTTPSWQFVDTSVSSWQAAGFDATAVIGNPLFVNSAQSNFQLAATSPAIDAIATAKAQAGWPQTDFNGNPRPHGRGYDIGAFEY